LGSEEILPGFMGIIQILESHIKESDKIPCQTKHSHHYISGHSNSMALHSRKGRNF
jgi:hypothetical protein